MFEKTRHFLRKKLWGESQEKRRLRPRIVMDGAVTVNPIDRAIEKSPAIGANAWQNGKNNNFKDKRY